MVKETDYAIFVYDVNDENLVFDLNSYINMHIQKILDFFEINSLVIKPKIKIYSTKKDFTKIYRKSCYIYPLEQKFLLKIIQLKK